jgi:predicted aspartyl protease
MSHSYRVLGVACLVAGALGTYAYAAAIEQTPALAPAAAPAPAIIQTPATAPTFPGIPTPQSVLPGAQSAPAAPPEALAEVVIQAPEPVYVAPTLRDRIGRIWAPVKIDGKGPFRLVLDTGASHSAITSRVANKVDDASAQLVNVLLHGVTGSAVVPALKVRSMEVGDMLIQPTTLPIVADAFGGAEGVLGREGLMDKRIFADFGRDVLTIAKSHDKRAPQGYKVIPLTLTGAGLLAADVRIGSVKVRAIIDTGGEQSVGNLALLEALKRHADKDFISENIIGVTLDEQRTKYIRVPPITMGSLKLYNVHVAFGDMELFEHWKYDSTPTLLIGMDVLGLFDKLIIDYKMREMQIRLRGDQGGGVGVQTDTDSFFMHRGS